MPPGTLPLLAPDRGGQSQRTKEEDRRVRADIDRIVRAANLELAAHQRIDGWRMWPERDFPRTHLLKVRRDPIREWAGADIPLAVREAPHGSLGAVRATSVTQPRSTSRPSAVDPELGRGRAK
jgi:hypothetical protein